MSSRKFGKFPQSPQVIPGFLLAALFAGMLGGCGRAKQVSANDAANAPAVAVAQVTRETVTDRLEIASEFQPFQEINVYAKVSGYVQKLNIDWGTHVRQGEVMAVLEIPELEQQVQLDQASLRRSEHDLERAREELNRARSAYKVAHLTYTRLADVQKSRPELVAQQDIDVAQGKDQEADAALSGAKAGLSAAEQGVEVARAELDKDQTMFAYARITAPFDGVDGNGRIYRVASAGGHFVQQRRPGALPAFAEQHPAAGDPRARTGRAGCLHRRDGGLAGVLAQEDRGRKNCAHFRTD